MGKVTLKAVAVREGVSERTVDSWVKVGKGHGLDPRNVDECKQIRALAGSAPAPGAKAGAIRVDPKVAGDLVLQLENARRMTQAAYEAYSETEDGAEQGRMRKAWESSVEAQMKIERTVSELLRSEMIHVDQVRAAFHSAWSQVRAKLEAGVKTLLPRLAGETEAGQAVAYRGWADELMDGVKEDAERRIDSV